MNRCNLLFIQFTHSFEHHRKVSSIILLISIANVTDYVFSLKKCSSYNSFELFRVFKNFCFAVFCQNAFLLDVCVPEIGVDQNENHPEKWVLPRLYASTAEGPKQCRIA